MTAIETRAVKLSGTLSITPGAAASREIHILFVGTSYEGSNVLGVYARKSVASKLCAWCKKNNNRLRQAMYDRQRVRTALWKKWVRHFGDKRYPSDVYYIETHQLQ